MSSGLEDSEQPAVLLTLIYHKETSPHYYLSYEKKWPTFENNSLTFNIVQNFLNLHAKKDTADAKSTDYLFRYENHQYILSSNIGQTLENFLNREKHTVTIFPPYSTRQQNLVHPTLYSVEPRNMGDPFQHLNSWL